MFMITNSIGFLISFVLFMPIAQVLKNLQYKCPLYSTIRISNINFNSTIIDESKIKWSNDKSCEYCIISGVLSVFYTMLILVFSFFFTNQMEKQLLPVWTILTVVQLLLLISTSSILTTGFNHLCVNFGNEFNCRLIQQLKWKHFNNNHLFDYIIIAQIASLLLTALLVTNLLNVIFRIKDFYRLNNKDETKEQYLISKYSEIAKNRRVKNFNQL